MIRIWPRYPMRDLNERLADPRLSQAQRDAMIAAVKKDARAGVIGLDSKMRPVIHANLPGPRKATEYALLRNGEPTKVAKPMAETWR
jgi:hypothetical protein